ncbi:hypothetical protein LTR53_015246 [Teratosphaeriaceae sp. CCFEE 6253]|nr:hypothetical protein LTR53_015246 [Teratosphaeriaceae sp. CCFEE 6253]
MAEPSAVSTATTIPSLSVEKAASTTSSAPSEEYTFVHSTARAAGKKAVAVDDEEPLMDTTAAIAKNSKRTKRQLKLQQKRQQRAAVRARPESFLDLPPELLQEILGYLRPSEVLNLHLLNHATRAFVLENERAIARDVLDRRYVILQRCFPLPVPLDEVDEATQPALLNPRREKMTDIHKKPYQHIRPMNTSQLCSCPTCLVAWNNLNIILDFGHFQTHLNRREPIPMIPRGTAPEWNKELIEKHAQIVEKAIESPLTYAAILELHLDSIVGALLRHVRYPPPTRMHQHNRFIKKQVAPANNPYDATERDATGFDAFLGREGTGIRASYDVPYHRDNYYSIQAYIPNRKWSKDEFRWLYYARGSHERDLEWTRRWFLPKPDEVLDSTPAASTADITEPVPAAP